MRTELLKEILALPTCTNQEKAVIDFLARYAEEWGYAWHVDQAGNVYVTKGSPEPNQHYPLVCSHTDSVHPPVKTEIVENGDMLFAVNSSTGAFVGCGGDDKCGVFICLELLERQKVLKAAFFVGEECYCIGSRAAEAEFFQDVGYCLEFDSPQGDIVSFSCDGMQLFDPESEFAKIAVPIMDSHGANKWQNHPYTDVAVLKRRFNFSCVNLPAGYYGMHSKKEYVKISEVGNSVNLGAAMLDALGFKKYEWGLASPPWDSNKYGRKVTGLVLERHARA